MESLKRDQSPGALETSGSEAGWWATVQVGLDGTKEAGSSRETMCDSSFSLPSAATTTTTVWLGELLSVSVPPASRTFWGALFSLRFAPGWFVLRKCHEQGPVLKWIYLRKLPAVQLWWILMDYLAGGLRCGVSLQHVGSSTGSNPLPSPLPVSASRPLLHNVFLRKKKNKLQFSSAGISAILGCIFQVSQHLSPDVCYLNLLVTTYPS